MESNLITINIIGQLIDKLDIQSIDKNFNIKDIDSNLIKDIEKRFAQLNVDLFSDDEKIILFYTHANYHAVMKRLTVSDYEHIKKCSEYVNPHRDLEEFVFNNYSERINLYRRAIKLIECGSELSKLYTSQVYVNLANLYMEMGRVIESVQTLLDANNIVKGFPMARGNLAIKHYSLATRSTDEAVMRFLIEEGLNILRDMLNNEVEEYVPLDILNIFYEWEIYLEKKIETNLSEVQKWDNSEDVDDEYKNWCSRKQLSLNYINIIYEIGNVDNIHMPNMGLNYFSKENNMEYYAWFNTIKQEYNMARYFMYQIDELESFANGHESQKHNYIVNTLDYPAIGYKTEMLKSSLKTAFSVLDKIGMFCCHFHNQQLPVHTIDFHKWYKQIKREIATRSSFNALYWLSQDLDTNKGELKNIRLLRNCLEHRYVRVLENSVVPLSEELSDGDKYEYIVGYNDLEKQAFESLKLVRNAIIYMASGFNIEFNKFYYDPDREHLFIPLMVDEYDDEWKN